MRRIDCVDSESMIQVQVCSEFDSKIVMKPAKEIKPGMNIWDGSTFSPVLKTEVTDRDNTEMLKINV